MRVFSAIPSASSLATTLPTIQSTSFRASPNIPRRVVFFHAQPAYCFSGWFAAVVWTWLNGM